MQIYKKLIPLHQKSPNRGIINPKHLEHTSGYALFILNKSDQNVFEFRSGRTQYIGLYDRPFERAFRTWAERNILVRKKRPR